MAERSIDDGGPAFPTSDLATLSEIGIAASVGIADSGQREFAFIRAKAQAAKGMSLRDYGAFAILPAIYREFHESLRNGECDCPSDWRKGLSGDAYRMVDAMLAARKAVKT